MNRKREVEHVSRLSVWITISVYHSFDKLSKAGIILIQYLFKNGQLKSPRHAYGEVEQAGFVMIVGGYSTQYVNIVYSTLLRYLI